MSNGKPVEKQQKKIQKLERREEKRKYNRPCFANFVYSIVYYDKETISFTSFMLYYLRKFFFCAIVLILKK